MQGDISNSSRVCQGSFDSVWRVSSVTFQWRSLTAVPSSPDEQLKVLNEKNKELEAAQDRNVALQVLPGLARDSNPVAPLALDSTECTQFPVQAIRISTSMSSLRYLHVRGVCVCRKIAGTFKVKGGVLANWMTGEQVVLFQFGWIVPLHCCEVTLNQTPKIQTKV